MAAAQSGVRGWIDAQLEGLSPRERKMIAGLILFFSVVFAVILVTGVRGVLNEEAAYIQAQKEKLAEIESMKLEWAANQVILASAEERMKKWEGKAVSAFFEQVAGDLELREELSVNKQATDNEGKFTRTKYRVNIRRLSEQQAVQLLYEIETSGYPIQVENVTLRTIRTGDDKVLTATLDVVHIVLKESP